MIFNAARRRLQRRIPAIVRYLRTGMRYLPPRVVFFCIVLAVKAGLPGGRLLPRAFAALVLLRLSEDPKYRFAVSPSRALAATTIEMLYQVGAYEEAVEYVDRDAALSVQPRKSFRSLFEAGTGAGDYGDGNSFFQKRSRKFIVKARALFELGRFAEALEAARSAVQLLSSRNEPSWLQLRGQLELLCGDETVGGEFLQAAAFRNPPLWCPHQNLAAHTPQNYVPTEIDLNAGVTGLVFDAYNYIGQRVAHVGEGQLSAALYAKALRAQSELDREALVLSPECRALLTRLGIEIDELRILPWEWFTQIGHEGMLDILFRMRELGWWRGKAVLLANPSDVANAAFMFLYDDQGRIFLSDLNISHVVSQELFSLQRVYGLGFNAFRMSTGEVVPWQDAGAMMMRQWESEGRGHPVRDVFDARIASDAATADRIADLKRRWGMKPDDWYVCLHMRDAARYGELEGLGQTHRNADLGSYISALKHITSQGGWVVKMGGPKSPILPPLPGVVDYARDLGRADILDLHLIRNASYFIGTTSGLTNVAISFGVPCALVNCITIDAQLWGKAVRFVSKRVRLRGEGRRMLKQRETTSTPWRWRVFSAESIARHNAVAENNEDDDILETVKEVECLARGVPEKYESGFENPDRLLERWRGSLGLPYFYGNARPGLYCLRKFEDEFLD